MKGRHSFDELIEVHELILVELIEHPEFFEVVDNQGLEVDVQFDSIVLAAPQHLPVLINKFLLENHPGHLQFALLALPFCGLLDFFGDFQGGFELLVLFFKGRIIEDGHFSMVHKILNSEVLL